MLTDLLLCLAPRLFVWRVCVFDVRHGFAAYERSERVVQLANVHRLRISTVLATANCVRGSSSGPAWIEMSCGCSWCTDECGR